MAGWLLVLKISSYQSQSVLLKPTDIWLYVQLINYYYLYMNKILNWIIQTFYISIVNNFIKLVKLCWTKLTKMAFYLYLKRITVSFSYKQVLFIFTVYIIYYLFKGQFTKTYKIIIPIGNFRHKFLTPLIRFKRYFNMNCLVLI